MMDKEELNITKAKTPPPLNLNEAIEDEVLNQKTARSEQSMNTPHVEYATKRATIQSCLAIPNKTCIYVYVGEVQRRNSLLFSKKIYDKVKKKQLHTFRNGIIEISFYQCPLQISIFLEVKQSFLQYIKYNLLLLLMYNMRKNFIIRRIK